MEKVAEHINEMQRIHEEYGAIFDHLFRQHQKSSKQVSFAKAKTVILRINISLAKFHHVLYWWHFSFSPLIYLLVISCTTEEWSGLIFRTSSERSRRVWSFTPCVLFLRLQLSSFVKNVLGRRKSQLLWVHTHWSCFIISFKTFQYFRAAQASLPQQRLRLFAIRWVVDVLPHLILTDILYIISLYCK